MQRPRLPSSGGGGAAQLPLIGSLRLPWLARRANVLLPLISIGALGLGAAMGAISGDLSGFVASGAAALIDGYGFVAPFLIFAVLAPVLSRIFSARRRGRFGLYVIGWLGLTKLFAMLWAVLFTVVAFGSPLLPEHSVSLLGALGQTGGSLLTTLVESTFFWAIYAAVLAGLASIRVQRLGAFLERGATSIEYAGKYIQAAIPLFMFAVGVYVQGLPGELGDQIGLDGIQASFHVVGILGIDFDATTTSGILALYVVGALLVGVAAGFWHVAILALAKRRESRFSVHDYFTNYWVKAYPLLWSTSSETLATPLNLYILKQSAPWIGPTVRRIVIGAGSVLCTNGTLISVFVLLVLVGEILGLHFSLVELLLCIPIAFLISFGIPGIPGELVLFAGPMAAVLDIDPAIMPSFLALYLGLQLGLPDSFRTGANSTNNYVYAIILNRTYEERFAAEGESSG